MTKGDKITAAGMIGLLLIASGADSMITDEEILETFGRVNHGE